MVIGLLIYRADRQWVGIAQERVEIVLTDWSIVSIKMANWIDYNKHNDECKMNTERLL